MGYQRAERSNNSMPAEQNLDLKLWRSSTMVAVCLHLESFTTAASNSKFMTECLGGPFDLEEPTG
jgi:hypothetical protein